MLSLLQEKTIKNKIDKLFRNNKITISYYQDNNFKAGFESKPSGFSDFADYKGFVSTMDSYDVKKFTFGNAEVGDIKILLSSDTELPDSTEYKVKYLGNEYIIKADLVPKSLNGKDILYYVAIGKM